MKDISDTIKENEGLVKFVLNSYYPNHKYDEDMFQEGLIGLWQAIESFDKSQEIKFNTYAARCIRNRINMILEKQQAVKRKLDSPNGCESLNNLISTPDGETEEWINVIKDNRADISHLGVLSFYKNLDRRKQVVMRMKASGYETQEVADKLNVSGQTVRRLWGDIQKEVIEECI